MDRLDALLQLQVLDQLPRTGWILRGVPQPESVAGHSLGTALLALALGPEIEPAIDVDRAVSLALLHDAAEACTGDIPRTGTPWLDPATKNAAEREFAGLLLTPLSELARERGLEALARETREARFVQLCDKLQLGVRLLGYVRAGSGGLEEFRAGLETLDCTGFQACEALRGEILAALDVVRNASG